MRYKPDLNYVYPEKTDEHMINVPHLVDTHFDEDYTYYDKSFWFRFKRYIMNVGLNLFGFLIVTLRHGLKIEGKKNIKKNKELFRNGAMTICNHVFMWDYLCVLKAIRPRLQFHMAWPVNFEGPNRHLIKLVGGVPIPSTRRAIVKFSHAIDDIIEDKKWLHIFPEASMWFYYPNIRPFKKGCFTYAVKHNKPIIPMAISYRRPRGLYKLFKGKIPTVTLRIGTPILPDLNLEKNEAIDKLHKECYHSVQLLAGIAPNDIDYQYVDNE